jgi:hypothetical protein
MGVDSGHLRVTHLSLTRGVLCAPVRRVGTCARGQSKGVGGGCDNPCLALIGIAHMLGHVAALTPATAT